MRVKKIIKKINKKVITSLALTMAILTGCGNSGAESNAGETSKTTAASETLTVETAEESTEAENTEETAQQESASDENDMTADSAYRDNSWRTNAINKIDDKYRTFYEIFVYSFCDSNGDGIGDLKGIISKLDYLNDGDDTTTDDLGITGIWLTPIMQSPSYHKYDVTDYMSVDEQFGTEEDFKELVDKCHERGIKVIIDLPINHTSSEHPWFKSAYEYIQGLNEDEEPDEAACPYLAYYNFTREKDGGYSEVTDTEWFYESRFVYSMPDLNLENETVKDEVEKIADYWLELGTDGFRMDAVKYFVTGNDEKNIELLKWFNDYVKNINPQAYIVCENWSAGTEYAPYYASGADSMFDFDFADKDGIISKTVSKQIPALSFGEALEAEEELYGRYSDEYVNAPFYCNHDMARSAGYYSGEASEAQTKMGNALNLMMSGNAFIYYGEEIGMKGSGDDENKRAPMYWSDDKADTCICDGPPNMDSVKMKYGSLQDQMEDDNSIYSFVRDCVLLRNQIPTIARGKTTVVDELSDDNVCCIKKEYEGQNIYIVFNISSEAESTDMTKLGTGTTKQEILGKLCASSGDVTQNGDIFELPAWSVAVIGNGQ